MTNEKYQLWYIPSAPDRTMGTDRRGLLQCHGSIEICAYPPAGRLMATCPRKPPPSGGQRVAKTRAQEAFGQAHVADAVQRATNRNLRYTPACPGQVREAAERFVQAARNESGKPSSWTVGKKTDDSFQDAGWHVRVEPGSPQYPYTHPRPAKVHFHEPDTERLIEVKALGGTDAHVWYTTDAHQLWKPADIYVQDLTQAVAHVCDHKNGHRPPPIDLTLLTAVADLLDSGRPRDLNHHNVAVTAYRGGQAGTPQLLTLRTLGELLETLSQSVDTARGGLQHHWVIDVADPVGGTRQVRTLQDCDDSTIVFEPRNDCGTRSEEQKSMARRLREVLDKTTQHRLARYRRWDTDRPTERVTRLITAAA